MLNWVRLPDLNFTNVAFYCRQFYMKSNPRLYSPFDSVSSYPGFSRRVPSSSRRPPSSSRLDFVPLVSHWRVRLVHSPDRLVVIWSLSSPRRRVRLVDSSWFDPFRLIADEFVSSTHQIVSSWCVQLVAIEFVSSTCEIDSSWVVRQLAFKECLPHFHSTQFSLWHHRYKCFFI